MRFRVLLVVPMQLHHPLLQLSRLIGRKAEIADVVGTVLVVVVVPELGLDGVGAQQSVRDEGARKPSRQDVVPQLQTQVVPGRTDRQTERSQTCPVHSELRHVSSQLIHGS